MMFTTHFKMKAHPFQEHTPTDHILQDARMREGLARMKYLAEAGTIGLNLRGMRTTVDILRERLDIVAS